MKRFDELSKYFKKYATQYKFEWLLLVAQGYQESGLDQTTRSPVGAIGVMQVMPTTAKDRNVNIPDIHLVEPNIHAGAKYMRFLVDQYFDEPGIDKVNRHLFAFAAYNGGPNRIARLRREAAAQGLDPDKWFNNVELLAAQQIGRETVQYVSNIYKYYVAYKLVLDRAEERNAAKASAIGRPRRRQSRNKDGARGVFLIVTRLASVFTSTPGRSRARCQPRALPIEDVRGGRQFKTTHSLRPGPGIAAQADSRLGRRMDSPGPRAGEQRGDARRRSDRGRSPSFQTSSAGILRGITATTASPFSRSLARNESSAHSRATDRRRRGPRAGAGRRLRSLSTGRQRHHDLRRACVACRGVE